VHSHCTGASSILVGSTVDTKPPLLEVFALWKPQRCFALAKPRGGVASDFFDEKIRLVTTAAIEQAWQIAKQENLTIAQNEDRVKHHVELGLLREVKASDTVELRGVSFPYARPALILLITRLASQYKNACGEKLVVTSLVRPKDHSPRNGTQKTVHPAGIAADFHVPSGYCETWLEENLLTLERRKVAQVTREHNPPHFHVVIFPREYTAYVKKKKKKD
jgi:hypothetical protein